MDFLYVIQDNAQQIVFAGMPLPVKGKEGLLIVQMISANEHAELPD